MDKPKRISTLFQRWLAGLLAAGLLLSLLAPAHAATAALPDFASAVLVLGQADFTHNDYAFGGQATLFNPLDVATDPLTGKIFVADTQNNRVLRFAGKTALANGAAAEAVLGQADFASYAGGQAQNRMSGPYSLAVDGDGRLWVSDTGNNRILVFENAAGLASGANATGLLGKTDFDFRPAAEAGATALAPAANRASLSYPMGLAIDAEGRLWVADYGSNRVLRFDQALGKAAAAAAGTPAVADGVLGQSNFTATSGYYTAARMQGPVDVAVDTAGRLWVVDTFNHRVLRFDGAAGLLDGAPASGVLGQPDLNSPPTSGASDRKLRRPAGVAVDEAGRLWVGDGNPRLLRFDAAASKPDGGAADGVLGQATVFESYPNSGGLSARSLNQLPVPSYDPATQTLWVADSGNQRVLAFGSANLAVSGRLAEGSEAGALVEISTGDLSPRVADATDFALVAPGETLTHTFVIANQALTGTLSLTGTQIVQISPLNQAPGAQDFSVAIQPSSGPLAPWESLSFQVRFTPGAEGLRQALVTIQSDDEDKPAFTFALQGTGGYPLVPADFTAAVRVLGQLDFSSNAPAAGGGAAGLYEPGGVALDPLSGKVFVADTRNNRVLRYAGRAALVNGLAAEAALGQDDLSGNSMATTQTGMKRPQAVACDAQGRLWVADTENNRVLRFDHAADLPSGAPASGVLGQTSFTSATYQHNRSGMFRPAGLAVDPTGRLWVADAWNNRILRFDSAAGLANGALASGVLGQASFDAWLTSDPPTSSSLYMPAGLAVDETGRLWVADTRNHRVLRFDRAAYRLPGAAADGVLGQPDFTTKASTTSQSGLYWPQAVAAGLNGQLWVLDSFNYRVLRFEQAGQKANGGPADGVLGQPDFTSHQANYGGTVSARSLGGNELESSGPQGLAYDPATRSLWVADTPNARLLAFGTAQIALSGAPASAPGSFQAIVDGDSTPDSSDGSLFALLPVGQAITHTFIISNTGLAPLTLAGDPLVQISGPGAEAFSLVTLPANEVGGFSSTTFQVRFGPAAAGVFTATFTIPNSSPHHTPFRFLVSGSAQAQVHTLYTLRLPVMRK